MCSSDLPGSSADRIVNDILIPGISDVGDRFERKDFFLPQLIMSADAMRAGMDFLTPLLQQDGVAAKPLGRMILATVKGDIHDIGKNIVCTLLENHGFEVIDLGKNVPAARILDAAQKHQVDAVGLSALMTTTLQQMEVVLGQLREAGIKVFTMVGGAVVTQDYADAIGADLYAADALEAVAKVKALLAR